MDSLSHRLPASITTDRLVLTTPTLDHVPEMALLANNHAIYQVLARLPHPYTEADGRFFVQTIARGESEFAWSILYQGRWIGIVSLIGIDLKDSPIPEIGYWLGQPFWGQGFGTEAAKAVVAAAATTGLPALGAMALTSNTASRHVLAKAGFVETHQGAGTRGSTIGKPTTFMRIEFAR
ncbi:GNAT family N-acetyltransferase [Devosia sp. FKR38]|uniref:GNAT family N-acetyltransferase n=1 Tax=Devosia sp. FKR38 TaxID=2562312 RepID=UPI0010C0D0B5|nr:GNAT family N-acetyltransferase [Devosia sp. FKR38]